MPCDAGCQASGKPFRILFCGNEFHFGYVFSKDALQHDRTIEVLTLYCTRVHADIKDMSFEKDTWSFRLCSAAVLKYLGTLRMQTLPCPSWHS